MCVLGGGTLVIILGCKIERIRKLHKTDGGSSWGEGWRTQKCMQRELEKPGNKGKQIMVKRPNLQILLTETVLA